MDVYSVDLSGELSEAIEQCFSTAPVVVFGPVLADLLEPLQRRALAPVIDQLRLRPTSVTQPRPQIAENLIADGNTKWFYDADHDSHSFKASSKSTQGRGAPDNLRCNDNDPDSISWASVKVRWP